MKTDFERAFFALEKYIIDEEYKGYDPYDTLSSPLPFRFFTKYGPVIATQLQKRNPINIRPLIGIKKEHNPKAMGLFLESYCLLQEKKKGDYKNKMSYFFNWLADNHVAGKEGSISWGYNFPWATTEKYLKAYDPTVVATAFAVRGLHAYFKQTGDPLARTLIKGAAEFVKKELHCSEMDKGIYFSYTPKFPDCCYNASLFAAEILARNADVSSSNADVLAIIRAVNFVIARQHDDGHWNYSLNISSGVERKQIDFHQGYVLDSIYHISQLLNINNPEWQDSLRNGLEYYKQVQFFPDGRSLWRIPREFPVEIHNQSQGIITFKKLAHFDSDYDRFSSTIAEWTIRNMQDSKGYFYYRKLPLYTNKISYMRWSNAWMFLALAHKI